MPIDVQAAHLRSFKYRRGRITPGQQGALDRLWPRYGVETGQGAEPLNLAEIFGRVAPVILEIGFGMGEATAAMAEADPSRDVMAIDVHSPGAGALLRQIETLGLRNVRVAIGDAVEILRDQVPPGSLDEIRIFFPDPWPKTRHRKRRLLSEPFARMAADRLRTGGRLHCATDWTPYAEHILEVVAKEPALKNAHASYAPRPAWRPQTRFERQGLVRGHQIHDIIALKSLSTPS